MNETINNKLLQQLIHAPSLWDNDYEKFEKTFVTKDCIDKETMHKELDARKSAHSMTLHNAYRNELLEISNSIQQSAKFKINTKLQNEISEKDFNTVLKDIEPFLPFQKNYVEFTDEDNLVSMLLEDVTDSFKNNFIAQKKTLFRKKIYKRKVQEGDLAIKANLFATKKNASTIAHIPCPMFLFIENNNADDYLQAWEDKNQFTEFINENSTQVNLWNLQLIQSVMWLQVLLSYPSLANTQTVSGRKPIAYNKLGKYKSSTMNALPKWEHKVLTVDLYASGSSSGGNGQGNGKRFHAVRKHLRQLNSGKRVFVKPHFRGDKSIGVVEKDYLIKGEK